MTKKEALYIISATVLVYLLGFGIPLMDIDASQYASISREMLERNSFLQVFDLGNDYLDKPPMLFWLSALSMKVFGIHDWAYRLPSFFFSLLATFSTYKLAALFYSKEVAYRSAVILATSQALFLINHDVRTDTMLMGWVAASIWQLAAWYQTNKWKNFLWGFICIAGGMMTKGPIALMVPVFAFLPHFAARREWKQLFKWQYILGLVIIGLLLIPMSLGLYQQFDLHPEKLVDGKTGISGLRFFYWTQSFGRITGESKWHENDSIFFLLQNMMWSLLPWIVFFLLSLAFGVKNLVAKKFSINKNEELITLGGFIITYLALGSSRAQLPHYIFVVFPLAAIMISVFLHRLKTENTFKNWQRPLFLFHAAIFSLLWLLLIALMIMPFPENSYLIKALAIVGLIILFSLIFSKNNFFQKMIAICLFSIIGINGLMNTGFYRPLLTYQLGNTVASVIVKNNLKKEDICFYGVSEGYSMIFYGNYFFKQKTPADFLPTDIAIISLDSLQQFKNKFPNIKVIYQGNIFGVTCLTLPFLNPATREKEIKKYVITDLDGK